ncbi:hypothetical protein B0H17DRAFT_1246119, partial [Mycena rosella]
PELHCNLRLRLLPDVDVDVDLLILYPDPDTDPPTTPTNQPTPAMTSIMRDSARDFLQCIVSASTSASTICSHLHLHSHPHPHPHRIHASCLLFAVNYGRANGRRSAFIRTNAIARRIPCLPAFPYSPVEQRSRGGGDTKERKGETQRKEAGKIRTTWITQTPKTTQKRDSDDADAENGYAAYVNRKQETGNRSRSGKTERLRAQRGYVGGTSADLDLDLGGIRGREYAQSWQASMRGSIAVAQQPVTRLNRAKPRSRRSKEKKAEPAPVKWDEHRSCPSDSVRVQVGRHKEPPPLVDRSERS